MNRSARIALFASVVWVVVIWSIWLIGDFYDGETQVAMLAGLAVILVLKFFLGKLVDNKPETDG